MRHRIDILLILYSEHVEKRQGRCKKQHALLCKWETEAPQNYLLGHSIKESKQLQNWGFRALFPFPHYQTTPLYNQME